MNKKISAHNKCYLALKRGDMIKPDVCGQCGWKPSRKGLHGHHDNYDKPLVVRWLCSRCHRRHHRDESISNGTYHCFGKRTLLKCDECLKAHVLLGDRHGKTYIKRQRRES